MGVTFCKGDESRRRVLDAALELFLSQGYEKTTMRQIIAKSGVLNGSVYHAFKNKDGIFEEIFNSLLDKVLDTIPMEELDVVTFLLLPAAIELTVAQGDKRMAELLHHANHSWTVFNSIVSRLERYADEYTTAKNYPVDKQIVHRYFLTTVGATSVFVSEYYLTDNDVPVRRNLRYILEYICALVHIPLVDADAEIEKAVELASAHMGVLDGFRS